MSNIKIALCVLSVLVLGSCARDRDDLYNLRIVSSDKTLERDFDWAARKAMSFVMTGTTGVINSSETYGGEGDWTYIPSYKAGLPYRSAFYIRDFCHQMSGAHLLGLQSENAAMIGAFLSTVSEERDWYPLWALNFDGSPYKLDYEDDSTFARYVPAVFELVEKLYSLYLWTGDRSLIDNPAIWKPVSDIMEKFVPLHDSLIPDGIAEGSPGGLLYDGISSYCDFISPLIESGDGFASQYRAYISYACLLEAKRDYPAARHFRDEAARLKEMFDTVWTVDSPEDGFCYARGLGQKEKPVGGFGFEGSIFIPLKGLADEPARTEAFLKNCDEACENSKTLSISSMTYLPDLFYSWNMIDEGWKWTGRIRQERSRDHGLPLVGNNGNYPEVPFTFVSNIVENLLGFEPDAPHNAFSVLSRLPDEVEMLGVENIPLGGHKVSVIHQGREFTTIKHIDGKKEIRCNVRFYGLYDQISIDGTLFNASHEVINGAAVSCVSIKIPEGSSVKVKAVLH
ncbi:MAG: hypothetical protein ACI4AE_03615 [Candidatus Cryptobacteroides sp.]